MSISMASVATCAHELRAVNRGALTPLAAAVACTSPPLERAALTSSRSMPARLFGYHM